MDEDQLDPNVTFGSFGLDPRVTKALDALGFVRPTVVQAASIPLALKGKDILAKARTGSGKTAAYAIPILHRILTEKKETDQSVLRALILVPTRELCAQLEEQFTAFTKYTRGLVKALQIGSAVSPQIEKARLSENPDILISTPARLLHHLSSDKSLSYNLSHNVRMVVIDEADIILSYGYERDLKNIMSKIPKMYQGFLMSATLGAEMDGLKKLVLHAPAVLKLEEPETQEEDRLKQYYVEVASEDDQYLYTYGATRLNLLPGKLLIFVNSIDRAFKLRILLERMGVKTAMLNSMLPLNSRLHTIDQFNRGTFRILIATDESLQAKQVERTQVKKEEEVEEEVESDDENDDKVDKEDEVASGEEEESEEEEEEEDDDDALMGAEFSDDEDLLDEDSSEEEPSPKEAKGKGKEKQPEPAKGKGTGKEEKKSKGKGKEPEPAKGKGKGKEPEPTKGKGKGKEEKKGKEKDAKKASEKTKGKEKENKSHSKDKKSRRASSSSSDEDEDSEDISDDGEDEEEDFGDDIDLDDDVDMDDEIDDDEDEEENEDEDDEDEEDGFGDEDDLWDGAEEEGPKEKKKKAGKGAIKEEEGEGEESKKGRKGKKKGKDGKKASLAKREFNMTRGLDLQDVDVVLNFDFPRTPEDYVHRVGRTARGTKSGMALTFVSNSKLAQFGAVIENQEQLGRTIEPFEQLKLETLEGFRYRVDDARRHIKPNTIRSAKSEEVKKAVLNNELLQSHFKEHPRDFAVLAHNTLGVSISKRRKKKEFYDNLRLVPSYLMSSELASTVNDAQFKRKQQKDAAQAAQEGATKSSKRGFGKRRHQSDDIVSGSFRPKKAHTEGGEIEIGDRIKTRTMGSMGMSSRMPKTKFNRKKPKKDIYKGLI